MLHLRRFPLRASGLALAAAAALTPLTAHADDPVLRHQEDMHGDVVVFGSTLGFDCGAGLPPPAGSNASCAGQVNVADGAPDLYWRDSTADASITATQARTSATLTLPAGAKVTYARLYWAGLKVGQTPDTDAVLDWLGGPQQSIVADTTWVVPYGFASHPDWYYYQASGDATDFVATWGAGDFRVSDVEALDIVGQNIDRVFSAWTLVVFYEDAGSDLRNLALFDSFTPLDPGIPGQGSASVTLSGFLVPQGFTARMSAFAYEGDPIYTGDHFTLNGSKLTNALNPAEDFFNSSRSYNGVPVSGTYDVPKLSGQPASMAGYDLDTVDVTTELQPGDTSCVVGADSAQDIFFLGGFITSVASLAPDFHGISKTAVDLDGGAVLPGDAIEYTIKAINSGNDASTDTIVVDTLEPGIELQPGTIEIVKGGALGFKTNAAGDDQGDYDAATRTITWRVGTGATASVGGKVAVGQEVIVRFVAKVTATKGTVANQAILFGFGESGANDHAWLSDSDPQTLGDQETIIVINECAADTDCADPHKPHCNATTHVCEGCKSDADCSDPQSPACQPTGSCGECSETNKALCAGETPACDTMVGICVLCTLGPSGDASKCQGDPAGPICVAGENVTVHCGCLTDSDCGDAVSGKVCDSVPSVCVDGCRGMGGNGCPAGLTCTSIDTTIGQCVPDGGEGGAGGGGTGGSGAAAPDAGDDGSCGCEVPGGGRGDEGLGALAALLGLAVMARRRRRA
jgi:fimbrial isopeptide formation D2 family protein